jgi:hypothetical protein
MRAPKAKRAGIEIKHEITSRVPMFPRPSFNAATRTLNVGQGTRLHGDDTLELVAPRNAGTPGFHVPETGKDEKRPNCSGSSFQMGEAVSPPRIGLPFGGVLAPGMIPVLPRSTSLGFPPPRNDGHPLSDPSFDHYLDRGMSFKQSLKESGHSLPNRISLRACENGGFGGPFSAPFPPEPNPPAWSL